MSDTRGGKPWGAHAALFAFAVALILGASAVGTGVLVGSAGVGNRVATGGSSTLAGTASPPNSAGVLAALSSGDAASLRAVIAQVNPTLAAAATSSDLARALAADRAVLATHGHPTESDVKALDTSSAGVWGVAGSFVFAAVICGATLGIACLAALGIFAAITVFVLLFGQSSAGALGDSADALAELMIRDAEYYGFSGGSVGTANQLSALTDTENALAYAAAAGALPQLDNSTFSALQDEVASGNAAEMEGILSANEISIADEYMTLLSTFSSEEGSDNSIGFSCPLNDAAQAINSVSATVLVEPNPGGSSCPVTASTYTYASGTVYGTTLVDAAGLPTSQAPSNPAIYVTNAGTNDSARSHFWLGDPSTALTGLTFVPITGGAWYNETFASSHQIYNLSYSNLPTGGYWVNTTAAGATLYASNVFPLDSAALPSGNPSSAVGGNSIVLIAQPNAQSSGLSPGTAYVLGGDPCAGSNLHVCAPIYGEAGGPNGTAVSAAQNQTETMLTLIQDAGVTGQTYWQFLRNLGYTSEGQVPAKCIIPTPGQLLPSIVTYDEMTTLNATQLLQLYYAALYAEASTFNDTNALSVSNFCGKHVTTPFLNVTISFGTYGLGWVYLPYDANDSAGTSAQHFGTPSSWNLSGYVYLGPAISDLTIPLNETWLLPEANPSEAFVIPLTNGTPSSSNVKVNINAPTSCLTYTASGCNASVATMAALGFADGNSTLASGSLVGTHIDSSYGPGDAVYLTTCFTATAASLAAGGSTPLVYTTTHPCVFTHETVVGISNGGNCSAYFGPTASCGTGGGGGILISAGGTCGWGAIPVISQLVAGVTSVVGTGSLGCLVADAIVFVVILVVAALVLYVVVAVLRRD